MKKILIVVFLGLMGFFCSVNSIYSLEEQKSVAMTSVKGEIVSVDVEKSTVIVKQLLEPGTNNYVNKTVAISPETKIQKGDVSLMLKDLQNGDQVTIQSLIGANGESKVKSITVQVEETVPAK